MTTTTYQLTGPDGESARVTSERAAKAKAREWLGAARLTETPTETGWQYWAVDADEDADCVTVEVL